LNECECDVETEEAPLEEEEREYRCHCSEHSQQLPVETLEELKESELELETLSEKQLRLNLEIRRRLQRTEFQSEMRKTPDWWTTTL